VAERELGVEAIEEPRGHEDEKARDDAACGARVRSAAERPRRHRRRRRREEPLPPEREGIGEEVGKEVRHRRADEEVAAGGDAAAPERELPPRPASGAPGGTATAKRLGGLRAE